MVKAILLIIALGAIYWFFWGRHKRGKGAAPADSLGAAPLIPEKMVVCAYCRLHVPESECLLAPDTGRHYCCDAHRQRDAR